MSNALFRVWSVEQKEYIAEDSIEELMWEEYYPRPEGYLEYEQSTERKDKKGKLIFEGDIVLYAEHGDWDRAYHGDLNGDRPDPEAIKWNPHNLSLGPDGYPFDGNPEYYEVIGNIRENPELVNA